MVRESDRLESGRRTSSAERSARQLDSRGMLRYGDVPVEHVVEVVDRRMRG
jgi:hypothetical protein